MKKRNKFILSMVLACALISACCTGCGSAQEAAANTPAVTPEITPAATPAQAVPTHSPEMSDEEYGELEMEAQEENRKNMWIEIVGFADEEGTVLVSSEENEEGVRADSYVYEDTIRVAIERLPSLEGGMEAIVASTAEWEGIPQSDIEAEEDPLESYPAYRLFYMTEDIWNVDLYVQTDLWDFRIHTGMPEDIPGMDEDEEYDYLEQTIIRWFYSVEIVSLGE